VKENNYDINSNGTKEIKQVSRELSIIKMKNLFLWIIQHNLFIIYDKDLFLAFIKGFLKNFRHKDLN